MTDDDLKGLLEASAAETRRHVDEAVGQLAEENRHHLETAERRLNENAERLATENRQYIQTAEQRLNENAERLATENRQYIQTAEQRLNENAERQATENRQYIQTVEQRLNENGERQAIENRRHFDIALEANRHENSLLAETITQSVEKLDRRINNLEERMETGFAETQAMIKFSHAELDRRVRTLEQTQRTLEESQRTFEEVLADLQTRVERLEGSTH